MKLNIRNLIVFVAMAAVALSCAKTPTFERAEKGPEMKVNSFTESTYMGANIKVNLNLSDADFALSTIKAVLYYGETEVASETLRTKTEGNYELSIQAPLLKEIPDGTANLVLRAQNVGLGITETTLDVDLKRPDFETLSLVDESGKSYELKKTEEYVYERTDNFPSYVNSTVVTPQFNDGETITLGWDGSALSASSPELIPFGSSIAGNYTIKLNLFDLSISPTGSAAVVSVAEYKKGQKMEFGNVVDLNNWTIDPDFFDVDKESKAVTFRAIDGLYKMEYDTKSRFIRVEPMKDAQTPLSLAEDGTGAVWLIGSSFGKPEIGPSWNTETGAYPAAQVEQKVYEFTLAVPGQLAVSGAEFKFFHRKGWVGEFKKPDFKTIDLSPAFEMTDAGNIKAVDVKPGKGYKIILDLTEGINKAAVSYEEVEVTVSGLDITVNGVKALKMSNEVYKVPAVKVDAESLISFTGIDNPLEWKLDSDHFEITSEGLKFKAVSGFYSFELNVEKKYVVVRHVKSDGKAATYADEKAITFMAWGAGFPSMSQELGWEGGMYLTLAQVKTGVYQFTGVACEDKDEKLVGNCWRYDYISFKFFGQAGWGVELRNATLTDEAQKYLSNQGNVELVVTGNDADGKKIYKPLELGATYRMTVTDCSAIGDDKKFDVTIDFRKL